MVRSARRLLFTAALGAMLICAPAQAQDKSPSALTVGWETLWQAEETLHLPIEESPSRLRLEVPQLKTDGGSVVCLRVRAYMQRERPSGWNNYLAVAVNDTEAGPRTKKGWPRVLNRPPTFTTNHPNYPVVDLFIPRSGLQCLQIFFGPPESQLADKPWVGVDEGYWYLLDISDLVSKKGDNEIVLINTALTEYWGGKPPPGDLVLEDLQIGLTSRREALRMRSDQYVRRTPALGVAVPGSSETVRVVVGGGIQVEVDSDTYYVESAFSYPHTAAMQYNHLLCLKEPQGLPGWEPAIRAEDESVTVTAQTALYSLKREVFWEHGRIRVRDEVTNNTDNVFGMALAHSLISSGPARTVRLSGLEASYHPPGSWPENPTIFAGRSKTGVGIVAEDNAMRLQMAAGAVMNKLFMRTERLALAPHETYALQFVVYPSSEDYFEFINAVRRDWDVNHTVPGPFDFFDARTIETEEGREQARKLLARKRLKVFALTPWFEYYNGWSYSREQYRSLMLNAMGFIKELIPDAKLLACVETNLVPVPLDFFAGRIPEEDWPIGREYGGSYAQKATPQMTAAVDASQWRDSCVRAPDGNVLLDCWYVEHYQDPPALNLIVYPRVGNFRYEHMLAQLSWLLDYVGFDGVYLDQFSQAYSTGRDRYTYDEWDGRTVLLDRRGGVKQQLADVGLISAEARRDWVKSILDRGKMAVCNSQPAVAELQQLPTIRFMETRGYSPLSDEGPPYQERLAKGQLHSPVGLGHPFTASVGADFFMRTLIAHLRFGLLYYCYSTDFPPDGPRGGEYGPLNHMFPFTPVELHEGWVLGRERLITCVSDVFHWPGKESPRVMQFDERGRQRTADAAITPQEEGYSVDIRLRDWWEVAVVLPGKPAPAATP